MSSLMTTCLTLCLSNSQQQLYSWYFSTTLASIYSFAVIFGFASGSFIALVPAVLADFYGVERLGAMMGILFVALVPGSVVGPLTAGLLFDSQGNYETAILIAGAMVTLSAAAILMLPTKPPGSDPETAK